MSAPPWLRAGPRATMARPKRKGRPSAAVQPPRLPSRWGPSRQQTPPGLSSSRATSPRCAQCAHHSPNRASLVNNFRYPGRRTLWPLGGAATLARLARAGRVHPHPRMHVGAQDRGHGSKQPVWVQGRAPGECCSRGGGTPHCALPWQRTADQPVAGLGEPAACSPFFLGMPAT
jgi:hypothetical protein